MLDANDRFIPEAKKILTDEEIKVVENWEPSSNLGRATKMQVAAQIYTAAMLRQTQKALSEANQKNERRMAILTVILALASIAQVAVEVWRTHLGR